MEGLFFPFFLVSFALQSGSTEYNVYPPLSSDSYQFLFGTKTLSRSARLFVWSGEEDQTIYSIRLPCGGKSRNRGEGNGDEMNQPTFIHATMYFEEEYVCVVSINTRKKKKKKKKELFLSSANLPELFSERERQKTFLFLCLHSDKRKDKSPCSQ